MSTEGLPLPGTPEYLRERSRASGGTAIPKIGLFSWAGLESIGWGLVIAHLVKWAVSFGYFAFWQVRYAVGYGPTTFTVWYGKDFWDRLVIHIQNGLPYEVAVLSGLAWTVAVLIGEAVTRKTVRKTYSWAVVSAGALVAGAAIGYGLSVALAGWHVHWFPGQDSPAWWDTWRHDIRDVGIALIATIIVRLMFAKPKYPAGDHPGAAVYLTRFPLAIAAALVPIAGLGVLAWKLPWLTQHGVEIPARYGAAAAAVNEWLAAGTWITAVMGIAGGLVATRIIQRVADDIQWFFGERSAAKLRRRKALSTGKVIGTPAHRKRVHWLLDNQPELPERSPWLVRILVATAGISLLFSGAGAWLNLSGPAAH